MNQSQDSYISHKEWRGEYLKDKILQWDTIRYYKEGTTAPCIEAGKKCNEKVADGLNLQYIYFTLQIGRLLTLRLSVWLLTQGMHILEFLESI